MLLLGLIRQHRLSMSFVRYCPYTGVATKACQVSKFLTILVPSRKFCSYWSKTQVLSSFPRPALFLLLSLFFLVFGIKPDRWLCVHENCTWAEKASVFIFQLRREGPLYLFLIIRKESPSGRDSVDIRLIIGVTCLSELSTLLLCLIQATRPLPPAPRCSQTPQPITTRQVHRAPNSAET